MSNMMIDLRQRRDTAVTAAETLVNSVEAQDRDFTPEEKAQYDGFMAEARGLGGRIDRMEATASERGAVNQPVRTVNAAPHLKIARGDSWAGAFTHWVQTGDKGGLDASGFDVNGEIGNGYTINAASNATDMNIGTAADGGDLVPVGFYNQIIAKRDETLLAAKLPILRVPGVGTTVDVPYDNEADGEFVVTSEAATFDLDAPALSKKALTLALYSKYTDVSYQLLDDTPSNLMGFLADFVGRGMAKTHNNLLLTEVATNGTSLKTFASATVIAFGEIESIVGNDDLSAYLDEDAAVAWVMRNSVMWEIKSLVGTDRQYAMNDDNGANQLLGYPVLKSQKSGATTASAKSVYFGNWRQVGMREGAGLTFVRDPYTVAIKGQIRLLWHFRTVYGVLQAEAIGYAAHPSA